MKKVILISLSIATLFAAGCSTPSQAHSTALDGAWHGNEVTSGRQGSASLILSGQTLEFHGAEANDWCKGTFTLRENTDPKQLVGTITDSPWKDSVGKSVYAIYKIDHGTLTISGNGPRDLNFPAAFDTPGTRQFVFKRD